MSSSGDWKKYASIAFWSLVALVALCLLGVPESGLPHSWSGWLLMPVTALGYIVFALIILVATLFGIATLIALHLRARIRSRRAS